MEKKYEVKDKEDSIKTFFLQYAERLSSEIKNIISKYTYQIRNSRIIWEYIL